VVTAHLHCLFTRTLGSLKKRHERESLQDICTTLASAIAPMDAGDSKACDAVQTPQPPAPPTSEVPSGKAPSEWMDKATLQAFVKCVKATITALTEFCSARRTILDGRCAFGSRSPLAKGKTWKLLRAVQRYLERLHQTAEEEVKLHDTLRTAHAKGATQADKGSSWTFFDKCVQDEKKAAAEEDQEQNPEPNGGAATLAELSDLARHIAQLQESMARLNNVCKVLLKIQRESITKNLVTADLDGIVSSNELAAFLSSLDSALCDDVLSRIRAAQK
jgi:hypothetical protein